MIGVLCFMSWTAFSQNNPEDVLTNREASHNYGSEYEAIAQAQLDAYNAKDIEAFLKPYAQDVEVFKFPNTSLYKGKEKMRQTYTRMFETIPNLHCTLVNRITEQNVVIDKELVKLNNRVLEATAIYVIKDFKIQQVYFIQ